MPPSHPALPNVQTCGHIWPVPCLTPGPPPIRTERGWLLVYHGIATQLREDWSLLMIHALNPFGMAHLRRVNEDNVDLNRNFLLAGEQFRGSPQRYRDLDPLLNPPTPPSRC